MMAALQRVASLDTKLRQGPRERCVDRRDLPVRHLVPEPRLGALSRFFDLRSVDILRLHRHVGDDGDVVAGDLDESLANGEVFVVAVRADDELARNNPRQQGYVVRKDPDLPRYGWKR